MLGIFNLKFIYFASIKINSIDLHIDLQILYQNQLWRKKLRVEVKIILNGITIL